MQISVEEVSRLLALTPVSREQRKASPARSKRGRSSADSHEVSADVTPTPGEIQFVRQQIDRLPDVREDRVQALKARIESGTYRIGGDEIADLIVRRALANESVG